MGYRVRTVKSKRHGEDLMNGMRNQDWEKRSRKLGGCKATGAHGTPWPADLHCTDLACGVGFGDAKKTHLLPQGRPATKRSILRMFVGK